MVMMVVGAFVALLSALLMVVGFTIIRGGFTGREITTPFECGFDPIGVSRRPFSLQFFLVAVIFLVFDVEVTLLLPTPILSGDGGWGWGFVLVFFTIILLLGLFHEWAQGALEWQY